MKSLNMNKKEKLLPQLLTYAHNSEVWLKLKYSF